MNCSQRVSESQPDVVQHSLEQTAVISEPQPVIFFITNSERNNSPFRLVRPWQENLLREGWSDIVLATGQYKWPGTIVNYATAFPAQMMSGLWRGLPHPDWRGRPDSGGWFPSKTGFPWSELAVVLALNPAGLANAEPGTAGWNIPELEFLEGAGDETAVDLQRKTQCNRTGKSAFSLCASPMQIPNQNIESLTNANS